MENLPPVEHPVRSSLSRGSGGCWAAVPVETEHSFRRSLSRLQAVHIMNSGVKQKNRTGFSVKVQKSRTGCVAGAGTFPPSDCLCSIQFPFRELLHPRFMIIITRYSVFINRIFCMNFQHFSRLVIFCIRILYVALYNYINSNTFLNFINILFFQTRIRW